MSSGHEHKAHLLPFSVYYSVAAALFVMTIITVAVAQYDFGNMNMIVAMVIAGVKASLVALFFMHLKYDNKVYASLFVGALVFLAVFIAFTMFDTETRGFINQEGAVPISARAVIYDQDGAPLIPNPHAEHQAAEGGQTGEPAAGATDSETSGDAGAVANEQTADPGAGGGH